MEKSDHVCVNIKKKNKKQQLLILLTLVERLQFLELVARLELRLQHRRFLHRQFTSGERENNQSVSASKNSSTVARSCRKTSPEQLLIRGGVPAPALTAACEGLTVQCVRKQKFTACMIVFPWTSESQFSVSLGQRNPESLQH